MANTKEATKPEEETKGTALAAQTTGGALSADMMDEFVQDAGAGSSQAADDNIVPFIVLLQDLSPEVKTRDPDYVKGAEVGMLLNKGTRQLYSPDEATAEKTGFPMLRFQHAAFDRAIIEWIPRIDGGGYVARHEIVGTVEDTMKRIGGKHMPDPADPKKTIWRTADGKHDLIDTRYHYGHALADDGTVAPAVIGFSSTGHTASREWMTLINNFKIKNPATGQLVVAPAWAKSYIVRSKPKKNTKGDFFVVTVDDGGVIQDAAVRALGKALNAAFSKGDIKADEAKADPTTGDADDSDIPV